MAGTLVGEKNILFVFEKWLYRERTRLGERNQEAGGEALRMFVS